MEPLEADRSTRSARVLGTFVSWAIAAANAKGISKIDPNVVVDRETLRRVGKVVCVYTTMPIVQGCTALLELISRLILLLIFLALSCSPRHRTVVVERVRTSLQQRINSVRGCARAMPRPLCSCSCPPSAPGPRPPAQLSSPVARCRRSALTGPGFGDAAFGSSADSLPTNARLLIVGAGGVGKTALSRALKRLAKKVRDYPPWWRLCLVLAPPARTALAGAHQLPGRTKSSDPTPSQHPSLFRCSPLLSPRLPRALH